MQRNAKPSTKLPCDFTIQYIFNTFNNCVGTLFLKTQKKLCKT